MHALATSQSGSRRIDTAYLQTTATPTGMQSAKLGQVTKYVRVIGQHELSAFDRLTDKLIAILRSRYGRSNNEEKQKRQSVYYATKLDINATGWLQLATLSKVYIMRGYCSRPYTILNKPIVKMSLFATVLYVHA